MNILILGGAGFIGQHLVHTLLDGGVHFGDRHNRVVVIDNLATSEIDLNIFKKYKNLFQFIEGDIATMEDKVLLKLFRKADKIYQFAGSVGVEHIDKNPSSTLFNNVDLMTKLIPLFQKSKTHVTFASTSEIYGEGPFTEESNASIGPISKLRWGYAASKLMMEFMIAASNFPYTIIRFFNVVGPGQSGAYGMVLPRMMEAARSGNNIIIYGDGQQVRSFCHIKDAINAILLVSATDGELYNIGNDQPVTIEELAISIKDMTRSHSVLEYRSYDTDFSKQHADIYKRIPCIDKLKKLGYEPKFSLREIIGDMI
jgi:UDP-glucose 4-epimerase